MAQHAETTTGHAEAHGAGAHRAHGAHAHGTTEYWMVFVILMVLLLATVGAAFLDLGHFNVPIAYGIAVIKAGLILWFFMHLKQSTRLSHVFAFASFAWLALMLLVTMGDYVSRHVIERTEAQTHIYKVDSWPRVSGIRDSQQKGESEGPYEPGQTSEKKAEGGHEGH